MSSEILNEGTDQKQSELNQLLDQTVFNIIREELTGLYFRRGGPDFGVIGKESMYDFIKVQEDTGDSRLIMVLFNCENSNWWYPEGLYKDQTMYPIGTDRSLVYDKFRTELEAGMVPPVVFVQTGERNAQEDDRWWNCFQTVCIEVKNPSHVNEVEELVKGLKTKEVLHRRAGEVEKILERIENDDSLVSEKVSKFDYYGISKQGQSTRAFVMEEYWSGQDNNES